MDMAIQIALTIMLGAAAFSLLAIGIFFIKGLSTLEKTNTLIENSNKTIDDINKKLDMIQEPIEYVTNGVMKISEISDKFSRLFSSMFFANALKKKKKNKNKGEENNEKR